MWLMWRAFAVLLCSLAREAFWLGFWMVALCVAGLIEDAAMFCARCSRK